MPDPKLKAVMADIERLLKKYDMAGVVLLSSPTHVEYLMRLEAGWSCAWVEGGVLRVRCKREDFPSRAEQKVKLRDTVGLIAGFSDATRSLSDQLTKVLVELSKSVQFDHVTRRE